MGLHFHNVASLPLGSGSRQAANIKLSTDDALHTVVQIFWAISEMGARQHNLKHSLSISLPPI